MAPFNYPAGFPPKRFVWESHISLFLRGVHQKGSPNGASPEARRWSPDQSKIATLTRLSPFADPGQLRPGGPFQTPGFDHFERPCTKLGSQDVPFSGSSLGHHVFNYPTGAPKKVLFRGTFSSFATRNPFQAFQAGGWGGRGVGWPWAFIRGPGPLHAGLGLYMQPLASIYAALGLYTQAWLIYQA